MKHFIIDAFKHSLNFLENLIKQFNSAFKHENKKQESDQAAHEPGLIYFAFFVRLIFSHDQLHIFDELIVQVNFAILKVVVGGDCIDLVVGGRVGNYDVGEGIEVVGVRLSLGLEGGRQAHTFIEQLGDVCLGSFVRSEYGQKAARYVEAVLGFAKMNRVAHHALGLELKLDWVRCSI
ncbi:hypothetical protein BpHYR1_038550 [Brachionus plicatilis]|uniref:Uncharacterized protein n=1 Tax=Brachionus plicatilis TaxID=10195 RepID=A0A3M7R2L4_BRAPC|nr:hypothetical protein BpHYR1_038550 [Brachionus plicatilis]